MEIHGEALWVAVPSRQPIWFHTFVRIRNLFRCLKYIEHRISTDEY
jgi:hypothetical protein